MIPMPSKEYHISELLYESECPYCKYKLEFYADFDADGTSYRANCCGKTYYAITSKLRLIDIYDTEE